MEVLSRHLQDSLHKTATTEERKTWPWADIKKENNQFNEEKQGYKMKIFWGHVQGWETLWFLFLLWGNFIIKWHADVYTISYSRNGVLVDVTHTHTHTTRKTSFFKLTFITSKLWETSLNPSLLRQWFEMWRKPRRTPPPHPSSVIRGCPYRYRPVYITLTSHNSTYVTCRRIVPWPSLYSRRYALPSLN